MIQESLGVGYKGHCLGPTCPEIWIFRSEVGSVYIFCLFILFQFSHNNFWLWGKWEYTALWIVACVVGLCNCHCHRRVPSSHLFLCGVTVTPSFHLPPLVNTSFSSVAVDFLQIWITQQVTFWEWLLSLRIIPLRTIRLFPVSVVHSFSMNWIVFPGGGILICLSVKPLKDIWVVSKFWWPPFKPTKHTDANEPQICWEKQFPISPEKWAVAAF